jgi:hypothetical protein
MKEKMGSRWEDQFPFLADVALQPGDALILVV